MIVYEVLSGGIYDGASVDAVYSTYEVARELALVLVRQRERGRILDNLQLKREGLHVFRRPKWTEEPTDTWSDGFDIVLVTKRTVDDERPMMNALKLIAADDEYEKQHKAEWESANATGESP